MKVALCFHGISYGKHTFKEKYFDIYHNQNETRKLRELYDLDIFIHTWNSERQDELISLYQPIQLVIEEINPEIQQKILKYDSNLLQILKEKPNEKMSEIRNRKNKYSKYCNFYSLFQVDQLRIEHEEKYVFKYDCVIHTRFDVEFSFTKNLNQFDLNKFIYLPESIKKKRDNDFFFDYLMMSNSELIKEITQIYHHLEKVIAKNNHIILAKYADLRNIRKYYKRIYQDEGIIVKMLTGILRV